MSAANDEHGSASPTGSWTRPSYWTLPLSAKTLLVDDLPSSRRDDALELIADAARRADNVGVDEYTPAQFDLMREFADAVLSFADLSTGRLRALVAVVGSRYVRSCHPTVAEVVVVTDASLSGRLAFRDLIRFGVELIRSGSLGGPRCRYVGALMNVFVMCIEHVLASRDEGFVITGCVPNAGLLAGQSGHVDSYIVYRQLDVCELPIPMAVTHDDDEQFDVKSARLRSVPYLPVVHTIPDASGTRIVVRGLRHDEIGDYYDALRNAAASGDGYGIDELPGLAYFARWYVDDFYNLVYELADNDDEKASTSGGDLDRHGRRRRVVAYSNFGPSPFSRSVDQSILSDGNIIVLPEFRGQRWSGELMRVQTAISADVGFRCLFGETAATNIPWLITGRRLGMSLCGSVPRGVYFPDVGWTDLILIWRPFDENTSFKNRKLIPKL